ncbi:hypothetical protein [Zhengella mangrovi]|uniref:hypothetical protein n=1 Tax=Zhengella mangrovi TaxID=1982044 RepID=UPI0013FD4288|nr:hypothetical protein [Zhengella mangrovi]
MSKMRVLAVLAGLALLSLILFYPIIDDCGPTVGGWAIPCNLFEILLVLIF